MVQDLFMSLYTLFMLVIAVPPIGTSAALIKINITLVQYYNMT